MLAVHIVCMKRLKTAVFVSSELFYLLNHIGTIPMDTVIVNNRMYQRLSRLGWRRPAH